MLLWQSRMTSVSALKLGARSMCREQSMPTVCSWQARSSAPRTHRICGRATSELGSASRPGSVFNIPNGKNGKKKEERIMKIKQLFLMIWLGTTLASAQISSFQHIVVIFQENRTPDNL